MDDFQLKITPSQIEKLLRKAIKSETIELVFQPKIEMASERICGVEVLCRWYDLKYGFIPPKDFIPLAEKSELIITLGEWILKQACQQNRQWQLAGYHQFPISVNISTRQLMAKNFASTIKKTLQETKLDPSFLDLEITESALLTSEVIENMKEICKLGVSFSLDDFGTGLSSLSGLLNLPIKALKIDKIFVNDMLANQRNATMVRAIIHLAKVMGLISIAEGVETTKQLSVLRTYQCDQMQGYLFSRPLPAERLTELLAEKTCPPKVQISSEKEI